MTSNPTSSSDSRIQKFNSDIHSAPGYSSNSITNLSRLTTTLISNTSNLRVGRPALLGGKIAFAIESSQGFESAVVLIDPTIMFGPLKISPVVLTGKFATNISDLQWIQTDLLVAATAKTGLTTFQVGDSIQPLACNPSIHSEQIREIAVQSGSALVASGGQDTSVVISDCSAEPRILHKFDIASVVSSVKWPKFNSGACVSFTTENGVYSSIDLRMKSSSGAAQFAFRYDSGKSDLFTHQQFSDYEALLGFGDGEIFSIDVRNSSKPRIALVQDPYVEGVGSIEFNNDFSAFVVSGYTDFSVWKMGNDSSATFWSHSKSSSSAFINSGDFNCTCLFFDRDTIFTTDSNNGVSVYMNEFN